MQLSFRTIHLQKRFPLAIARGVHAASDNLFVTLETDGVFGIGEMSPGESEGAASAAAGQRAIEDLWANYQKTHPEQGFAPQQIHDFALQNNAPACALAALDIALWDALGKRANLPLYQLLGLGKTATPTSLTIGINPPEVARERAPLLLDAGARALKIKLGSPQGEDADRAMFAAVAACVQSRKQNIRLRVDANGGWDVATAKRMMQWLAEFDVEYVEQPLAEGMEDALPEIFRARALPIFVDESCRFAGDLRKFAAHVDGVNIKLMKCGGVTGALRIIAAARALGLQTMLGCMGESSLSISAAASLGGLSDYMDLDSHLNLAPDPCDGATFIDGVVAPNDSPGHGARINL